MLLSSSKADTGRREQPRQLTAHQGGENWRQQRMRNARGGLDAMEEEDRSERNSMLSTSGRPDHQPNQAVLAPLPGAVSPEAKGKRAAREAAAAEALVKAPKHLAGSEPDAITAELSERLGRRAAPARGGDGMEDVWRGWMPVPSLPPPAAVKLPKVPVPSG